MEAGVKPVCIVDQLDVSPKMQELIEAGRIAHIGDYHVKNQVIQVYAQSDKEEEGKELFARYYKDGEGYPKLAYEDEYRRVGELLGYNQNDIDWALGKKYRNNLINSILMETIEWRCKIRKDYMLRFNDHKPD